MTATTRWAIVILKGTLKALIIDIKNKITTIGVKNQKNNYIWSLRLNVKKDLDLDQTKNNINTLKIMINIKFKNSEIPHLRS